MVIFLYGPDVYRSRQKLRVLKKKFIEQKDKPRTFGKKVRGKKELSISYLEGAGLTCEKFRQAALTAGFFSKKRLIIIENLIGNSLRNQAQDTLIQEITNFVKKKSQDKDNIVIFWEEDFDKSRLGPFKRNLYNLLKKSRYSQEFQLLTPGQVKLWTKREARARGINLESSAVEYLTLLGGNDLWSIKNELDKLLAYSASKNNLITLKDVKTLSRVNLCENIWNLVDAIGLKNKKIALKLLADQIKSEADPSWLISMLARQYRIILKVKLGIQNQPLASARLAKMLGLHPFVCQKALEQGQKYSLAQLKKIYRELLKIDLLRKMARIEPEVLLDLLIVKS